MQPGTAMCFLNFYTLVFWTPLFHIYMKRWSGPSLDASVFYVVTNALKCALEVVC